MASSNIFLTSGESLSSFNFTPSSTSTPLILKSNLKVELDSTSVINSDGKALILTKSNKVSLFNSNGEEIYNLNRSDEDKRLRITSLILLQDKQILISSNSNIYSYNLTSNNPLSNGKLLFKHPSSSTTTSTTTTTSPSKLSTSLAINSDSTLIASTNSSSLLIHNLTTSTTYSLHSKPRATYSYIQFHATRRTLLSAATITGLLHVFDTSKPSAPTRTFNLAPTTTSLPSPIVYLAFSTSLLIAATSTGTITLIDFEKMKVLTSVDLGVSIKKNGISLSSDGRHIVFLIGSNKVGVMDLKTRNGIKEISVGTDGARITGVCFQPVIKGSGTIPKSPPKPSAVLAESLNKARLEKALYKGKVESLKHYKPLSEIFSPVEFGSGFVTQTSLVDSETIPSSRVASAESMRREAQTSTLRPLTLKATIPMSSLSTSSHPHSPPASKSHSSDLPSRRPTSSSTSTSKSTSSKLSQQESRQSSSSSSTVTETPRFPSTSTSRSASISSATSQSQSQFERSDSPNLPSFSLLNNHNKFTPGPGKTRLNLLRGSSSSNSSRDDYGEQEEMTVGERTPLALGKGKEKAREAVRAGGEKRVGFGSRSSEKISEKKDRMLPSSILSYQSRSPSLVPQLDDQEEADHFGEVEPERSLVVNNHLQQQGGGGAGDILKAAIRSVMDEYHSKSSNDVQNLHVELMKQSHVQKMQMRSLLSSYLGKELQELREENKMLKIENERLRRGY